ncbi:MAG: hypothetical protein ACFFAH_04625 [Promethearchaeota archaeon]
MSILKQPNTVFKREGNPNACLSLEDSIINIKAPHKTEAMSNKEKRKIINNVFKSYKRVCKKCGAFVPLYQFVCGMCMSSNIRKAYNNEIQQILQELCL